MSALSVLLLEDELKNWSNNNVILYWINFSYVWYIHVLHIPFAYYEIKNTPCSDPRILFATALKIEVQWHVTAWVKQ